MASDQQNTELDSLRKLLGYVSTCRQHNQADWMDGLVDEINHALKAIGDSRFAEWDPHADLIRWKERGARIVDEVKSDE